MWNECNHDTDDSDKFTQSIKTVNRLMMNCVIYENSLHTPLESVKVRTPPIKDSERIDELYQCRW